MAQKGGFMGSKIIDEIPDIFIESIKLMKDGEISKPIKSSGGFHLIKLNKIEEFEMETIVVSQSKVKQIYSRKIKSYLKMKSEKSYPILEI
jgi:parvulin-like peptidyl-prolyl isomerase